MTSEPPQNSDDDTSLEERFLAGVDSEQSEEPDDFDLELSELKRTRKRGSVLRPILMIIVVLLVGSVLHDWRHELGYFFTFSDPVELGSVAEFPVRMSQEPGWEPPMEHNAYVSLQGMPTRMSRGGQYEIFRLIGAEIYVQRDLDEEEIADGERSGLPPRQEGPGLPVDEHRRRYVGEGRLLAFESVPERVAGLKQFYGERYNMRFCDDYTPRQIEDLERQRRETFRSNWQGRYERATEEVRAERELTPEPTDADVEQNLDRHPVCVNAYLLHDDRRPLDHWWYLALSILLSAFMLFNIYKLVAWFRDWIRP